MATETKKSYARASQFIKGLGDNLDKIEGTDMLLHSYEIEENRPFGDSTNTLVTMKLSTLDDPENQVLFHAWSESLASRLQELENSEAELPLVVAFERVKTSKGFKVWTVK